MARENLYSRAVVWVKIILPLAALALLSSLFLLSGTPDPDEALPYAEVDIEQITREQRVSQPRFAGLVGEGQEIVLIADAVTVDTNQTDRIRAQQIEGHMDLNAHEFLTLEATSGDIDMAAQLATLRGGVILQTSLGYRIESDSLLMALDVIDMRSPTPIHITGPGLDITADSMELTGPDGEAILRFNGSVRVLYEPQS